MTQTQVFLRGSRGGPPSHRLSSVSSFFWCLGRCLAPKSSHQLPPALPCGPLDILVVGLELPDFMNDLDALALPRGSGLSSMLMHWNKHNGRSFKKKPQSISIAPNPKQIRFWRQLRGYDWTDLPPTSTMAIWIMNVKIVTARKSQLPKMPEKMLNSFSPSFLALI